MTFSPDSLAALASAAELAYREYGLGKCPDDQMLDAREQFEWACTPERILLLAELWKAAVIVAEWHKPSERDCGCPLCSVLARLASHEDA